MRSQPAPLAAVKLPLLIHTPYFTQRSAKTANLPILLSEQHTNTPCWYSSQNQCSLLHDKRAAASATRLHVETAKYSNSGASLLPSLNFEAGALTCCRCEIQAASLPTHLSLQLSSASLSDIMRWREHNSVRLDIHVFLVSTCCSFSLQSETERGF